MVAAGQVQKTKIKVKITTLSSNCFTPPKRNVAPKTMIQRIEGTKSIISMIRLIMLSAARPTKLPAIAP
ncbi:New ORF [Mycoplasmoides pneumoniae M129]|nr:New ORF [Mycoplasmoides pneumoniae M129]